MNRKLIIICVLTLLLTGLAAGSALAQPYVPDGQSVHSGYTKNTDACASCHFAHRGEGTALLQWNSTYATCMACHDGTIDVWNVKDGDWASKGLLAPGGKFDTGAHGSKHDVTGNFAINAAPGGKMLGGADEKGLWTGTFGCESCHNPHGQGGNARLLSADPNGIARVNKVTGKVLTQGTDGNGTFFAVKDARGEYEMMMKGYPYTLDTKFYVGGTPWAGGYEIDNSDGYSKVRLTGYTTGTVTAEFVPALKVKMDIRNKDTATEEVQHIAGMNAFCGACHTDYDTTNAPIAARNKNGKYSQKTRHQVGYLWDGPTEGLAFEKGSFDSANTNIVTCLTCHVAHGVDKDYWEASLTGKSPQMDGGVWDQKDGDNFVNLAELSGSSVLKRKPNMGVCETCHEKGDANAGYDKNVTASPEIYGTIANADYVGSATCAKCHNNIHSDWNNTLHSKMAMPGPAYYIDKWGSKAAAQEKEGSIYKNMIPEVVANWNKGPNAIATMNKNVVGGALDIDEVWYAVGSKFKQRYAYKDGAGRFYFGSKQWYTAKPIDSGASNPTSHAKPVGEWDPYTATSNWENFCIACHATGVKVQETRSGATLAGTFLSVAEMGIGCEACHGPGSAHAEKPLLQNIVNPYKLTAKQQVDNCGQCHNRGFSSIYRGAGTAALGLAADADSVRREDAPGFKPGDTVEDWFSLYFPNSDVYPAEFAAKFGQGENKTNPNTGNTAFLTTLNSKYGSSDRFESQHHQQFQGFRLSKHYGLMTCTTCHDPHKDTPNRRSFFGNANNPHRGTGQLVTNIATMCANCHGSAYTVTDNMPFTARNGSTATMDFDIRTHKGFVAP